MIRDCLSFIVTSHSPIPYSKHWTNMFFRYVLNYSSQRHFSSFINSKHRSLALLSLSNNHPIITRNYSSWNTVSLPFLLHFCPHLIWIFCSHLPFFIWYFLHICLFWCKICTHLPLLIREAQLIQICGLLCASVPLSLMDVNRPTAQVNNLFKIFSHLPPFDLKFFVHICRFWSD